MTISPEAQFDRHPPLHWGSGREGSTWQDLAGHWLRIRGTEEQESRAQASRLAAVQRWRGLQAEFGPRRP